MKTDLLEAKGCEDDYMTWLEEDLRGMSVEDDVIEILSECVPTISCSGGFQDLCELEGDRAYHQGGSSIQSAQGSTQELDEEGRHQTSLEECVRNASCPGECHGSCRVRIILAAQVCKNTRTMHRICHKVLTAGTIPRSLGCQGIKILWIHELDEWECLQVDETVFLK